jgi:hypothetical protein
MTSSGGTSCSAVCIAVHDSEGILSEGLTTAHLRPKFFAGSYPTQRIL